MYEMISFIETAIQEGKFSKIRELVIQLNVVDIAHLLDDLDEEKPDCIPLAAQGI